MTEIPKTKEKPAVLRVFELYNAPQDGFKPITTVTERSDGIIAIEVAAKGSVLLPRMPILTVWVDRNSNTVKYHDMHMGMAEAKLDSGDADMLHRSDGIVKVLSRLRNEVVARDKKDGKKTIDTTVRSGVYTFPYRYEVGWDSHAIREIDTAIKYLSK